MLHAVLLVAAVGWFLPLDGPWRFHVGDDPRWAAPAFDDSAWATQNLAAPAEAKDGDQGITHFAPGWSGQGFSGYRGFAWYRIRVDDPMLAQGDLAILGPAMADSAYQIYVDGRLVGGIGDFNGASPLAYAVRPSMYPIPGARGTLLVAIRVWMGPWVSGPRSGGMHVAPVIGNAAGVRDAYAVQWFEKIRAFSLEIVQSCIFILLALIALAVARLQQNERGPVALAIALLLTAGERAHLTTFWCLGVESVPAFFAVSALLVPATLCAWLLAWMYWLDVRIPRLAQAIVVLSGAYAVSQFLKRPAFSMVERYALLCSLAFVVYAGLRRDRLATVHALPSILLVAIGQFGAEVARLGVPGIWFPFGMGVSLTNYAYLAASPLLLALLWSRATEASSLSR